MIQVFFNAFWDNFASTINAYILYSGEGKHSYLIMIAFSGIVGILFTSILIGIFSSAIESKLEDIQYGNSKIIEENHIIVLGFSENSYQLIRQLCLAYDGIKSCIVVVGNGIAKNVMHQIIRDNIDVPKEVKIKCRNIDFLNPNELNCCSIYSSKSVIISGLDDDTTIKALLSISKILRDNPESSPKIVTSIVAEDKIIPAKIASDYKALIIHTKSFVARLIAYSCMQLYISNAFFELFSFDRFELYIKSYSYLQGKSFLESTLALCEDSLVGIARDNKVMLNPDKNELIKEGDKLIVLSENLKESKIIDNTTIPEVKLPALKKQMLNGDKIVIIGYNDAFNIIIKELNDFKKTVYVADYHDLSTMKELKKKKLIHKIIEEDVNDIKTLENICSYASHVVILSDNNYSDEEADMHAVNILLNLRDIKTRLKYSFNT